MGFKSFGECSFHIAKAKHYPLDFLGEIVNEFIFIFGILLLIKDRSMWSIHTVVFLLLWYMFQFAATETVYTVEEDIRSDSILNLLTTRTDLFAIYMKRSGVFMMRALCVFLAAYFCIGESLSYHMKQEILWAAVISVVFSILVLQILISMTFIWERARTFVSLFLSVVFIFGFQLPILREIWKISKGDPVSFPWLMLEMLLLVVIWRRMRKKAENKIYHVGF